MIELFENAGAGGGASEATIAAFGCGAEHAALGYLRHCPVYAATPLQSLPGLAAALNVASIHIKDESARLRLGSFKALGGAYAVLGIVHAEANARLARDVPVAALLTEPVRAIAATMTFACATDGNHGRSVAAGARLIGAKSVIFVHAGVSAHRVAAIRAAGATVEIVVGRYDDAVAAARQAAAAHGWALVSDTSWPGYADVPTRIMQGYLVIAAECWDQLPDAPTHIFVQAGVGGFAATVAAHAVTRWPSRPPRIIVVEPKRAACLLASARAGVAIAVPESTPTIMAMLECFAPSLLAFDILKAHATAFVAIDDAHAASAMRQLAHPRPGDPAITAGESGAAGIGALVALAPLPAMRTRLGLGEDARILVFNTEGATDPASYCAIVGGQAP